jgi:hypothetical protein
MSGIRVDGAVVVVPTYQARGRQMSGDKVFDHPTPLADEGTLARLLESMNMLKGEPVDTVVISVPTADDIAEEVHEKVEKIIAPFRSARRVFHFSPLSFRKLHAVMSKAGKTAWFPCASLDGYSDVRNACVLAAHILSKEAAVLIDDDEVFEDELFMDKALEFVGEGRPAIAGYYVQPHGGYDFKGRCPWYRFFWNNQAAMNEAFRIIGEEPRLKETPFVFGGNMILHKSLFRKVPFDPSIRRGEDISYLCDAKHEGYDFVLDRELSIKHLPPSGGAEPVKMREDIYRFIYMRNKLLMQGFPIRRTQPYPGRFLKADLYPRIILTNILYAVRAAGKGKCGESIEFLRNIGCIPDAVKRVKPGYERFFQLKELWPEFMGWVAQRPDELRAVLYS